MHIQLAEDLSSVQKVGVVNDLVDVISQERQVENECHPVAIDQEEEGQKAMDGCLRDDICV